MITPMVVREPFDREGWVFELKWDGFRAITETDGQGAVKFYSRNQKRFPPIALSACRQFTLPFSVYSRPSGGFLAMSVVIG